MFLPVSKSVISYPKTYTLLGLGREQSTKFVALRINANIYFLAF